MATERKLYGTFIFIFFFFKKIELEKSGLIMEEK